MEPSERAVYVTFDDGPIPEATPWVLDVLDRYGVKATFFVVGDNVRKHPDLFREIIRRGHSVGNHTFHHISGHIHGDFHFQEDVELCQREMEKHGLNAPTPPPTPSPALTPTPPMFPSLTRGKNQREGADTAGALTSSTDEVTSPLPPREGPGVGLLGPDGLLFRPPHGWMKPKQYRYVADRFRIIMWDLVTRDYSNRLTAADVVNNIKRYAREGSIITFHDSLKSIDKLRTALPQSIEWLQAQGYEFRKL